MMMKGHKWLRALILSLGMITSFVACSTDDITDVKSETIQVTFTMSLDEALQGTRANTDWSDYSPNDPTTDAENTVDVSDLQILICDKDSNMLGQVENVVAYEDASSNSSSTTTDTKVAKTYIVMGSWTPKDDNALSSAKKVMVFANCSQNGTAPSFESLSNTSLSFDRKTDTPLPMWGVVTVSGGLTKGESTDLGKIWLLRATAKVSVSLGAEGHDMSDYKLKSVTLNNYNTKGYVLPKTWNTVDDTQKIKFSGSLNPQTSKPTDNNGLSFDLTDDKQSTKTLYIPEYDNTSEGVTHTTISLTLTDKNGSNEETHTLQFAEYENGKVTENYHDIQRNHYYKFEVYKDAGKLVIKVYKWNEKTHSLIVM